MRIQRIETFTRGRQLCVVRITADDGAEGWGQIAPFNANLSALASSSAPTRATSRA